MKQHLLLGLALVAAAACSKSSAKPSTKEQVAAKKSPQDLCDEACTALAVCTERLHPEEHFRDGGACAEHCMSMSPAGRDLWVKDTIESERKNECEHLLGDDYRPDEEEAAMYDPALATVPEGELKPGCFAWSERLRSAACIVGENGNDGVDLRLAFLGGDSNQVAPLDLVKGPLGTEAKVADVAAANANDRLATAGFKPIEAKATTLANRKPKTINGVTFRFTTIEKDPGGEGVAPTKSFAVLALSEGKTFHVLDIEGEGLDATSTVRVLDKSRLLVETQKHVGREGEFNDSVDVALIDLAAGKMDHL